LHVYRDFPQFANGLEGFDEAEEACIQLMEEYAAAEKPDYITWGASEDIRDGGNPGNGGD